MQLMTFSFVAHARRATAMPNFDSSKLFECASVSIASMHAGVECRRGR